MKDNEVPSPPPPPRPETPPKPELGADEAVITPLFMNKTGAGASQRKPKAQPTANTSQIGNLTWFEVSQPSGEGKPSKATLDITDTASVASASTPKKPAKTWMRKAPADFNEQSKSQRKPAESGRIVEGLGKMMESWWTTAPSNYHFYSILGRG